LNTIHPTEINLFYQPLNGLKKHIVNTFTSYDRLANKRKDDNIGDERLWRVGDDLYDFEPFMKSHPGGEGYI